MQSIWSLHSFLQPEIAAVCKGSPFLKRSPCIQTWNCVARASLILIRSYVALSCKVQGVSKKRYFLDFLSYFSSRGRILLFHMCFGIRILSPFHLAIQKVSIQNLNCPKNACAGMIFIPALRSED